MEKSSSPDTSFDRRTLEHIQAVKAINQHMPREKLTKQDIKDFLNEKNLDKKNILINPDNNTFYNILSDLSNQDEAYIQAIQNNIIDPNSRTSIPPPSSISNEHEIYLGVNSKGEKFFFIVLPTGAKKLAFYDSENSKRWFYHSNDTALDLVTPSDINMFTLIGQTFGSNDEKLFFDLPSYQNIYYMNSTYIPNKIKRFTSKEIDERSDVFAYTIKSKLYEYFPSIDIRRRRKKSSSNSSSSKSSSKSSSNSQTRRVVKRKKSSSKSSSNGSSTNSQTRKKQTKQQSRGGARKTRK